MSKSQSMSIRNPVEINPSNAQFLSERLFQDSPDSFWTKHDMQYENGRRVPMLERGKFKFSELSA